MARCEICGKGPGFGLNRPWSRKATKRMFKPNIQKVTLWENGRRVRKKICTRCLRTLMKAKV